MSIFGHKITGAILAGGRNSRFPYLKGFIRIGGSTIIENNISVLKIYFDTVLISANDPKPYQGLNCPIVNDSVVSRGPLSGIYSCLEATGSECLFVTTCDMPFINGVLIETLCRAYLETSRKFDALVPVYRDKVQPLFGIYSVSAMEAMKKAIFEDKVRMASFLREIDTHYMEVGGIISAQGERGEMAFVNINTPEDLEAIERTGFDTDKNQRRI